jgi:hypothetical protein
VAGNAAAPASSAPTAATIINLTLEGLLIWISFPLVCVMDVRITLLNPVLTKQAENLDGVNAASAATP